MFEMIINKIKGIDKFYIDNVESEKEKCLNNTFEENETTLPMNILHDYDIMETNKLDFENSKKTNIIYYISDLHLDHKIAKRFPIKATKRKISEYINSIVLDLINDIEDGMSYNSYLLIGGDVSFNFEISKIFYEKLVHNINSAYIDNVIVVLGNHEFWEDSNIDKTIKKYTDLFERLNITFLNNELICIKGKDIIGRKVKLSENDINNCSEEELKKLCLDSKLLILGGTGFSGLNKQFNATYGLYRNAVKTIEKDKALSLKFEQVYSKLKRILTKDEVIVLTHTPKRDWSNDNYKNNWFYVNGHTHRNEYFKDEERTVYADNQIGYHNTHFGLKYFNTSRKCDIFKYYENGIYKISIKEYINFMRGNGINMEYNRKDGTINMLKKDDIYCFIIKADNERLYLLDGGRRKKLNIQDLNYYYENMSYYSNKLKESTQRYQQYLKEIALFVKNMGGDGIIHGCIIDIDFYNHLYVNPYDGKISPYFATSIVDKYVYRDLNKLLSNKRPDLYLNYQKMTNEEKGIILRQNNEIKLYDFEHYEDTAIYRESRVMKSLQYLINDNIVRIWNDNLIENKESLETLLIEDKK